MKPAILTSGPRAGIYRDLSAIPGLSLSPDGRFLYLPPRLGEPETTSRNGYLYRRVGVQDRVAFYRYVARILRWRPAKPFAAVLQYDQRGSRARA